MLHHSPYYGQALGSQEIRLLTIVSTEGTLQFTTKPHKLTEDLEFDAISYVWGVAPASVEAICNDKAMLVTPTAHEMLKHLHLHRPAPHRPLWIDAICINQKDMNEKAIQIPLMRHIYSRAACVVVWMGPSTPQTDAFVANFPRVSTIARKWVTTNVDHFAPGVKEAQNWPPYDDPFWTGCFHLLNGVWFTRMWTFQETILAKRALLLCGAHHVDLDDFIEFSVNGFFGARPYIPDLADTVPGNPRISDLAWEECRTIQRYREIFLSSSPSVDAVDIPQLLNILRPRRVQEPVDRIWAVSGLFEEALQKELAPFVDYSPTARTEYWKTYVNFAKVLLQKGPPFTLLCLPPSTGNRNTDLPSWCPNPSGQPACDMYIIDYWNYPVSSPGQPCHLVFSDDGRGKCAERVAAIEKHDRRYVASQENDSLLRIRGFCVDTISEVVEDPQLLGALEYGYSPQWSTLSNSNPTHVASRKWESRSLNLARCTFYGTDEGVSAIPPQYLMAMYMDCRISEQAETAYLDAMVVMKSGDPHHVFTLDVSRRERAYECIGRFKGLSGHSFFSTTGGRIGIATPGCKPGDKVCVFYGGHPLHLLRWPAGNTVAESAAHSDAPAEFTGVAFIPHLMEPREADAARLGEDEVFVIG